MSFNSQSTCLGQTYVSSQVQSMSWTNFGEGSEFANGIISIGTVDGSAMLFNARQIIEAQGDEINEDVGLLAHETQLSEVPIYSIKHNPLKNNLIALAGNEMSIIDISKSIQSPDVFSPGEQSTDDKSVITDVSWNEQL